MAFSQGSVVSAIGGIINTIVNAIASVVMTIVSAIVTVSRIAGCPFVPLTLVYQVIVTIFDLIVDILCCRICSSRRRVGTRRYNFGRRGAAHRY